ncbi:MAG: hypothetical protein M3142_09810, partial [Bacteroidota bacterium]|nr:hypothetical protein [Bacteroidota bacterium]
PLLTLVEDSVNRRTLNYPQDIKVNDSRNILSFNLNTKAKKTVELIADTTILLPVSGDRFKKQDIKFTITDKDQGGSIDLKVQTTYTKYFLELLDKDYKLVRTYDSPKNLLIEELPPNTYRIRVKIDEDGNGEWRGGNKDLKTVPEKVYNYLKPVEVRVNWAQDIPIEI